MSTSPSENDPPRSMDHGLPPLPTFKNPKHRHLSHSAAKRESVQLLGSIKDLQAHFSRAGLVEHRPGAGAGLKGISSISEDGPDDFAEASNAVAKERERVEDDEKSRMRGRRPWKDVELSRVDVASAQKEAGRIVRDMKSRWGLSTVPSSPSTSMIPRSPSTPITPSSPSNTTSSSSHIVVPQSSGDIREILISSAQAIRRIKTLSLSISGISIPNQSGRRVSSSSLIPTRPSHKHRAGISTPSRPGGLPHPRAVSSGSQRTSSLPPGDGTFGPGELRKAALDVLGTLRHLEERLRIASSTVPTLLITPGESGHQRESTMSPLGQTPTGSSSTYLTEDTGTTSTRPTSSTGIYSEPESVDDPVDEEEYNLNALAAEEARATVTWEERLTLDQHDYRNLTLEEWEKEINSVRDGLRRWCRVVGKVFFGGAAGTEEKELESWAREAWEGEGLARVHAFLLAHLSDDLHDILPPPDDQEALLSRLADGYLLIQAYNTALSDSPRAWGFIPDEDIHDTLTSTTNASAPNTGDHGGRDREWTFRRVGNLTCWAAAIRLRYNLPIRIPGSQLQQPSTFLPIPLASEAKPPLRQEQAVLQPHPARSLILSQPAQATVTPAPTSSMPRGGGKDMPRIEFDPLLVARKGEGWEDVLMGLMGKWVEEVATEFRDSREGAD